MPEARPNTFKIAQLNAENLFLFLDEATPRDWRKMSEKEWQKLSRATVPNKSLTKTIWLADSLLAIDADVVALNEVGGLESIHNFNKLFLQNRYEPHLIEGNSNRGIDIGFLVRRNYVWTPDLRSHKNRPLGFIYPHEAQSNGFFAEKNPEKIVKTHYFSRDCAELRLTDPATGKLKLIILLVHLKSKLDPEGIDPAGKNRREAELKALINIYRELREGDTKGVPIIVTGDFNGCAKLSSRSEEFLELNTTDLESVTDILGFDEEKSATQLQFNRNSQLQHLQIDYIFISPELKSRLIAEATEVFRYRSDLQIALPLPTTLDQRLHLPSDHYPMVAAFKF